MAIPLFEWVDSSIDSFEIKIQATKVEVDGVGKPLPILETPAVYLDHLDFSVNAFGRTVSAG